MTMALTTDNTPETSEAEARAEALTEGGRTALRVAEGLLALAGAAVLRIAAWRFSEAEALIVKAGRKAVKLGLAAPRLASVGVSVRVRETESGRKYREDMVSIAVFGVAPKVNGFRFLARVEHTEVGNIVTKPPCGVEAGVDLTAYRTAAPDCAHCGAARRRKDTFVLQGEDGALVQVGRNCLADFIRSEDLKTGLALWQLLTSIGGFGGGEDDCAGPHGSRPDFGTVSFVAAAVASIRLDGFRKSDQVAPTKNAAFFALNPPPREPESAREWDRIQPTEADFARAETVVAWVLGTTDPSDYLHNLRVACALPNVERRGGLLASAPVAFARAMEREVEEARRAARERMQAPGSHLGEVGKRSELGELTVVRVRFVESDYGTRSIVALEDAGGNQITWFASGAQNFDAGDKLQCARGTVKKHDSYKGRAQTVVSRLTWKDGAS